ncbi:hypothetical protein EYF80_013083 [Scomber scombrus]|uniref:Uncharacterized protein n=1 Tax=Scomber scombrus TaxID=13677 RepID=A0AAV1PDC4_SCOSC
MPPGAECQHRGQMGAPVLYLPPGASPPDTPHHHPLPQPPHPPPFSCHLCRPAPSCQQFKSGAAASWRSLACARQLTTQLCRCCQGWGGRQKMATPATARLTSVLPVGTTEWYFLSRCDTASMS